MFANHPNIWCSRCVICPVAPTLSLSYVVWATANAILGSGLEEPQQLPKRPASDGSEVACHVASPTAEFLPRPQDAGFHPFFKTLPSLHHFIPIVPTMVDANIAAVEKERIYFTKTSIIQPTQLASLKKIVSLFKEEENITPLPPATKSRHNAARTLLRDILQRLCAEVFFLCAFALPITRLGTIKAPNDFLQSALPVHLCTRAPAPTPPPRSRSSARNTSPLGRPTPHRRLAGCGLHWKLPLQF